MQRSHITVWQGISITAMFILGSPAVMGAANEAGADSCLGVVIGLLLAVPAVLVYARVKRLRPGEDMYGALIWAFGRVVGKVLAALITWYALHLGALTLHSFTRFIGATALPQTPQAVTALMVGAVAVWAVKSGQNTLGRWSTVFFLAVACTLAATLVLAIPYYDAGNLLPAAYGGAAPLLAGGTTAFATFAEVVVLLFALSSFKEGASPYSALIGGVAAGGLALFLLSLRDTLILGGETLGKRYYPSYTAVRVISFGDFFQRFEIIVGGVFLLCGLLKAAVCLMAAARGIARLFDIKEHKKIAAPTALLMTVLSVMLFKSPMEMPDWMEIYKYYAFSFQVLIPLAVWIAAEVRSRRGRAGDAGA